MNETFVALVALQEEGRTRCAIETCPLDRLPDGEVLVDVRYSSLNYKDALAVTGKGKILRQFPMAPGIDLAGYVVESQSREFRPGQPVLATGWGLGERHWGGYSRMNRVPAEWLTSLPGSLDLKQAMALGTAGLTAMLCVDALERYGITPSDGPVLVTGASGGVGNLAVASLSAAGYSVTASTGRTGLAQDLGSLGASDVIGRADLAREAKPLEPERWAAAVDVVGGQTLATVLSQVKTWGAVAACGLAGGAELPVTVFPFILRGVALLGVQSMTVPQERRPALWQRLSDLIPGATLDRISNTIPLTEVPEAAGRVLAGEVQGRLVVDVQAGC